MGSVKESEREVTSLRKIALWSSLVASYLVVLSEKRRKEGGDPSKEKDESDILV